MNEIIKRSSPRNKIAIIFLLFASAFYFTGCEKDDNTVSTSDRDKFTGTWSAESSGSGGTRNFTLTITASNSSPDQIIMENFDQAGDNTFIPATVSGNSVSLVRTNISGEYYEGSGTYSNQKLNFTFTVDDGQTIEHRTCTAHK